MLKHHAVPEAGRPRIRSSVWRNPFRLLLVIAFLSIDALGISTARADGMAATPDTGIAARSFLASLGESQRSEAVAAINAADRGTWTYLAGDRTGLRLGDLLPEQRAAFDRFLAAALSEAGLRRVREVLAVEPTSALGFEVNLTLWCQTDEAGNGFHYEATKRSPDVLPEVRAARDGGASLPFSTP